ncbi:MAG: hypothetical protein HUU01_17700 [Saprospiraceae bacterium]|nr:hypothetical protein [Saprospiraceae bacterium]
MKKHILPTLLALVLSLSAQAQSCLPEGITFYTQAEVDQFPALYPGCTAIGGDVYMRPPGVVNLDSLIGLISIGGDLIIDANLVSLRGLDSLTSIGGSLLMHYTSVPDMSGLNKLQSIQGKTCG